MSGFSRNWDAIGFFFRRFFGSQIPVRVSLLSVTFSIFVIPKQSNMKIKDYLKALPKGEVVNKKALALFKRLGYIWDYSHWGYLESIDIKSIPEDYTRMYYCFPKKNAKVLESFDTTFAVCDGKKYRRSYPYVDFNKTSSQISEEFGYPNEFEYEGMSFRIKYYDGCFNPYLIKNSMNENRECVHHSMAFPSGVV